jgi:Fe-S-cluster containining protein
MLADLCEGLFESLDAYYAQNPPPVPLGCAPGCAHCCHNQVRATLPEILTLVMHLRETRTELEREGLRQALAGHNRHVRGVADLDIPRDLPCIFLKNDRCSVYEVRPFACRGWHAIDREDCRRAFELRDPMARISHYPERRNAAVDFARGLTRGLENIKLPGGDIILPLGIEAVLPSSLDRFEQGWVPLFQVHTPGNLPDIA